MLHVVSHYCLFLCIHVSTSVERVIAEKVIGLKLTKKFLYCMQPELSLPYIIQLIKIEILKSLKSGKTDFKDFNVFFSIKYIPQLVRSLSPQHGASSGCIWKNIFQYVG